MRLLDLELDLVNLRSETYTDSRIPQMTIGTPKQDAERRDLTINSLFYNINTSEVVPSNEGHRPDLKHPCSMEARLLLNETWLDAILPLVFFIAIS